MPILARPRHEMFAQKLAKGCPSNKAYEHAGYSPDDGHASRLARNGQIQARVFELQAESARYVNIEQADVLRMLLNDRELARERGQAAAAVRATELLGRELGMFVDRREVGGPGDFQKMTEEELHAQAIDLASSPSVQALLKRMLQ